MTSPHKLGFAFALLSLMGAAGCAADDETEADSSSQDVIGTFKDPQTNESVAVTLLQNVIVLATGKITGTTNVNLIPEAQREYSNVSLLVIPEEAEILVLASELGGLTMSLRNEDDVDVIEERGRATINTLLSGERTRVLQQKRFNTIQVIRGSGEQKAPTP